MAMLPNRRSPLDRRIRNALAGLLERRTDRRDTGERRASPRALKRVRVMCEEEELSAEYLGELSLEGASFRLSRPLASPHLTLKFCLPDVLEEITVPATVFRTDDREDGLGIHVKFGALDVKRELALARFLEKEEKLADSRLRNI